MYITYIKETLENRQIGIYFCAVVFAAIVALLVPHTTMLEIIINPALALMLFVTFLQVPLTNIGQSFKQTRFLTALLIGNFIGVPILIAGLIPFVPADPMVQLGILLVLLTPCVDYVVTFAYLGRADARLLLTATPILLIVQILLLPVYLKIFIGKEAAELVQFKPFIHAFIWLIAIPLLLAALVQFWKKRSQYGERVFSKLALLPVPATALVLFVVIAAVLPRLSPAIDLTIQVIPIYIVFATIAPLMGWGISRFFRLDAPIGRTLAFSIGTRNSLVVLPLTFAIPGAVPILPAIIVTQTLVELITMVVYVRLIPKLNIVPSSA